MNINDIYTGDSNNILKQFPNHCVDLVVTDAPYLVNYKDRNGRSLANDGNAAGVLPVFDEIARVLKHNSYCIVFCGWSKIADFALAWQKAGLTIVGHIVWTKGYCSRVSHVGYSHEAAYVLTKGFPVKPKSPLTDVMPWTYSGNKNHPTEKSVEVITPLIQSFSKVNDIVLDPFLGSGTMAVAAALNQRNYIGIELEAHYCKLAKSRLAGVEKFLKRKSA